MRKRQILWAIAFGAMLAITGCGDDSGNGGNGGSGGSGGSGGGSPSTSCQAICNSTCVLEGVDPGDTNCLAQCQGSPLDDDCGSQAQDFLDCIEGVDCDPEASECQSEAIAWGTCIAGVF